MSPQQRTICEQIMALRKDIQVMGKRDGYYNPYVARHQDYYCLSSDDIWISADQMLAEVREFEKEIEEALLNGNSCGSN